MIKSISEVQVGDPVYVNTSHSTEEYCGRVTNVKFNRFHIEDYGWVHAYHLDAGWTVRKGIPASPELFSDVRVGDTVQEYNPSCQSSFAGPRVVAKVEIGLCIRFNDSGFLTITDVKGGWYYNVERRAKPDHWPFLPKPGDVLVATVFSIRNVERHTVHKVDVEQCRIMFVGRTIRYTYTLSNWNNGHYFKLAEDKSSDGGGAAGGIRVTDFKITEFEVCSECGHSESPKVEASTSVLNNVGLSLKQFRMGLIRNNDRIITKSSERV